MEKWKESKYAEGQIEFYNELFKEIIKSKDDEIESEEVMKRADFVARALYAFNTKDSDQGRRDTTPQDVYKKEIARFIRMFWERDVEGNLAHDDFFALYSPDTNYTESELQDIGKLIVIDILRRHAERQEVERAGQPEECVTSCEWVDAETCGCTSTNENVMTCPPEACGLESRPKSLRRLVRALLRPMPSRAESPHKT